WPVEPNTEPATVPRPAGADSGSRVRVPSEIRHTRPKAGFAGSVMFPDAPQFVASAGSGNTSGTKPPAVMLMNHSGEPAAWPLGRLIGATTSRVSTGGLARSLG